MLPAVISTLLVLCRAAGAGPPEPFLTLDDEDVPLTTAEAAGRVGEHRTVCGVVAGAAWIQKSRGKPTFLNLDRPWPEPAFTVLIWEDARKRFPTPPEAFYPDQRICVTGTILEHEGTPEIVVDDPAQIQVVEADEARPATGR
jgi:micrococcal nuclease